MKSPRRPFSLTASSCRTLVETAALAGLILLIQVFTLSSDTQEIAQQTYIILPFLTAIYAGLRLRIPDGKFKNQVRIELNDALIGTVAQLVLVALSYLMIYIRGVIPISDLQWIVIFPLTAVWGFLMLLWRAAIYLWLFWTHLRRTRMIWSLTHAILVLVIGVLLLGIAFITILTIFSSAVAVDHLPPDATWLTVIYNRLIYTVLPMIGIIAFAGGFFIILVLPPAALFSFLYARKTTARIDKLANAARALEQGHLETRVIIEGEDEVAQLQGSFNSMAAQIQQTLTELQIERDKVTALLKSRQDLVAGVSHELRTPVAVIRGYTENLLQTGPTRTEEDTQQQLEIMEKEILRLQALLDDLFTLSRVEVGKLTIHCQPLNLADSINQAVATFAPIAWRTRRVEISAQVPTDLPAVNADETRLTQILTNLIRNAIRYTSPGGLVLLSAAAEDHFVRLDVRDTGEGIAPEVLDHIWERYYQAPEVQNSDQTDSAGLGLALVKELTEAMHGTVSVTSIVGEGSCFSIFLPCA